jgi:hypothetical protein
MAKKITIKRLNELAKDLGVTQNLLKFDYGYFQKLETTTDIGEEEFLKYLEKKNKPEEESTPEEPEIKEVKNYSDIKTLQGLAEKLEKLKKKQLSTNPNASRRLELGYTKIDWKTIVQLSKKMDPYINKLITDYMSDLIIKNIDDREGEEATEMFNRYDLKWKTFIRSNVIGRYPGSISGRDVTKTRERLLGLFGQKINEILDNKDLI